MQPPEASDVELMGAALCEAEAALAVNEVPVGCVFVHARDGIIGRGHNNTVASCNATRHAELEAIDKILGEHGHSADVISECTLYVTVEPCIMCASALRQLRVRRVVYGCANDKFGGCGTLPSTRPSPHLPRAHCCGMRSTPQDRSYRFITTRWPRCEPIRPAEGCARRSQSRCCATSMPRKTKVHRSHRSGRGSRSSLPLRAVQK
jgi:tRNA(Arg) A34 adenosine deaminase TadA